MPTLVHVTGFNSKNSDAATIAVDGTSGGTAPTYGTSVVRAGGASLRMSCSAVTTSMALPAGDALASAVAIVGVVYVRFATFPSVDMSIFWASNLNKNLGAGVGYQQSSNQFCVVNLTGIDTYAYSNAGGPTLSTGIWYRVEFRVDGTTSTWATDVQFGQEDGTATSLTTQNFAAGVTGAFQRCHLGMSRNVATYTVDMYATDLAISQTSGDYPIGPITVRGYRVNAVGTHNLDASTSQFFFQHDGTSPTAITSSETTSYTRIDDDPTPSSSPDDRLRFTSAVGTPAYIDPSGDGANNAWTKSTGTAGFSLLDDATRQPTAPSTGTDRITTGTAGLLQDIIFPDTLTYSSSNIYTLWLYGIGGSRRGVSAAVSVNDGTSFGTANDMILAVNGGVPAGWSSWNITSQITNQTQLNQLRIRLNCTQISGGSPGVSEVDEVYVAQTQIFQPSTANYLEYQFADESGSSNPLAVVVKAGVASDGGGAATNSLTTKIYDGTSEATVWTKTQLFATSPYIFYNATFATKPSGGAWTVSVLNSTLFRIGYTNALSDTPPLRVGAVIMEAAFVPSVATGKVRRQQGLSQAVLRAATR